MKNKKTHTFVEHTSYEHRKKIEKDTAKMNAVLLKNLFEQQAQLHVREERRQYNELVQATASKDTDRLPGCREMFGDLMDLPIPSNNPIIENLKWKFVMETKGNYI